MHSNVLDIISSVEYLIHLKINSKFELININYKQTITQLLIIYIVVNSYQ